MADNTQLNVGSGGDVIKTEDVGAFKIAVSKIYLGAAGVNGGPVTPANPLPVSVGNFPASQVVSGTVSIANYPASQTVSGSVSIANFPASQAVTGSVSIANFPTTQAIAGSVSIANFPATQAVTGSVSIANFPTTQAITASALPLPSGAATSAKQPAFGVTGSPSGDVLTVQGGAGMTPLSVQGAVTVANFPATQAVSGSVSVGNFPATQAVSGSVGITNFPASQVVTGSVGITNFPASQAVTGTVGISGTVATTAHLIVSGQPVTAANPVSVTAVSPLPAGTNTIGAVIAQTATGVLYSGGAALTPKFAAISASVVGDNPIVAAVVGKKIRVLKYTVVTSGSVAAKFRTSAGPDLTGAMSLAANSGVGGAYCPVGLFETAVGESLILHLSSAVGVAGHLTFIEV